MKTVYAMITTSRNLNCSHCDIKSNQPDNWNEERFLRQLDSGEHNILFGGEPSLYIDRVMKAVAYCDSISTNLLYLPKELLQLYNDSLKVATSWNVSRFSDIQYETWLKNVRALKRKPLLLITLTPDLLKDDTFIDRVQEDFVSSFSFVSFEQLHDPSKTQSYYDEVDEWLCSLYREWKDRDIKLDSNIFDGQWYFDCDDTYTLYPDGTMKYGCPEYQHTNIPIECYHCEYVSSCRPCRLQSCCTAPHKLIQMTKI